MKRLSLHLASAFLSLSTVSSATVFRFDTDPFAGSNALVTPGRQIAGGESLISFSVATDLFSLESTVFGVSSPVLFQGVLASSLPGSGVNVIVLQDTPVPLGAGGAADLIAAQITTSAPGFFVYFNSGLDLPRLVYSTDLSDNTADLKILYRLTNLSGQPGRDALPTFSAANFDITTIPEPATAGMFTMAGLAYGASLAWRRRRARGADVRPTRVAGRESTI